MQKKLEEQLAKEFPTIFHDLYKEQTSLQWGIECDDGWFDLIRNLCADIVQIDNKVVARQVKQKLGGLRFYFSGGSEEIKKIVDKAEEMSYSVCEVCSQLLPTPAQESWKTLCAECSFKE